MATVIRYTNISGSQLTKQQVSNTEDYKMEEYIDGVLKRIDVYYDNKIDNGIYYLASNEDLQTVLVNLSETWRFSFIYFEDQFFGNFKLKDWEIYEATVLIIKGKTVYDELNREIAIQYLDIDSLEVTSTNKIFYLPDFGDFENTDDMPRFGQFEFYYSTDSSKLKVEVNLHGFELKEYYITNDRNILQHFLIAPIFSWDDHLYYHSAMPLIPNTTV